MELAKIIKNYGNKERCYNYIESVKWGSKPICPYCDTVHNKINRNADFRYHCSLINQN